MKYFPALAVILFQFLFAGAQKNLNYAQQGIKAMPYLGLGLMVPSGYMNEHSMIRAGVNFRFGYFQPVTRPVGKNGFQAGVELRVDYSKFTADLEAPLSVSNLRYNNGGTTPATVSLKLESKEKKPDAFHFLIGPSAYFSRRSYFFQPSLLLGYASFAQEPFRYYDTIRSVQDPSQNQSINFYTASHETNNGFVVVPGLKAGYRINPFIAAFISADYSIGGSHDFTDRLFVSSGNPVNGVYEFQQLKNGTITNSERKSRLRALALNINLSFTLPRK
jgi:hypothetical protein